MIDEYGLIRDERKYYEDLYKDEISKLEQFLKADNEEGVFIVDEDKYNRLKPYLKSH
jgi:hypothetical protein